MLKKNENVFSDISYYIMFFCVRMQILQCVFEICKKQYMMIMKFKSYASFGWKNTEYIMCRTSYIFKMEALEGDLLGHCRCLDFRPFRHTKK